MRPLIPMLCALFLVACAPKHSTQGHWPTLPSPYTEGRDDPAWATLATAYQWIEPTHLDQANTLIESFVPKNETEASMLTLVKAKEAFYHQHTKTAQALLASIDPPTLPETWRFYFFDAKAQVHAAFQQGSASLLAHLNALSLLNGRQIDYKKRIAKTLMLLPEGSIQTNHFPSDQQWDVLGWVEFAWLAKTPPLEGNAWQSWQDRFAGHEAGDLLRAKMATTWPHQTNIKRIGLLLPQQGPYRDAAYAIQTGLMAAYYQQLAQEGNELEVVMVDTSEADLAKTLEDMKKDYDILIGPLSKAKVEMLCTFKGKLPPTLTLNTTPNGECTHPSVHTWQLSAQYETPLAKANLNTLGVENVLIVAGASDNSQKTAHAFDRLWHKDHPRAQMLQLTGNPKGYAEKIRTALGVDESEARYQQIREAIPAQPVRFMATRRGDIEAIFLALNEKEATKAVSLLHYYFAGDLPLIGTSAIQSPNAFNLSHDLHQVQWPQSTYLAERKAPNPTLDALMQQIQSAYPDLMKNKRHFLALGADAFHLALGLHNLLYNPTTNHKGLTGQLLINDDGQVWRQLTWYQNRQGRAKRLATHNWRFL